MTTDHPTPPRQVARGRYALVHRIARGGMAEVWLARDTKLDRQVALKMLFPELSVDPSFVERFRREAQAAANLSHPNIVSIFDWGEEDSSYFIVMEYVEGQPLSALIRAEGPLLADRAAGIAADVAAALAFAHRNGVIHRDVKPGNVLITVEGQVKVTDFGIARAANTADNLTQTGAVMGTATYFSPEQAQGLSVDARSDVYSLGVVLYEMVTARPPFVGEGPMVVAYKHVNEPITPPRQLMPGLQPAFEAIVLCALAKNPAQRYGSAQELRADLLRFRQGRPVEAVVPAGALAVGGAGTTAPGAVERPTQAATIVSPAVAAPNGPPTEAIALEGRSPRSNTWIYGVLLVVLLASLAVVLYLLGRSVGAFGGSSGTSSPPTGTVAIPNDVIGKSYPDAAAEIQALGLVPQRVDNANAAPAGQVYKVSPDPTTQVAKGSQVELDVSSGPPSSAFITVPSVVGKTYAAGGNALQAAGFVVTPKTQPSDTVPSGTIISQDPAGGVQGHQGDTVTVTVSTGKAPIPVPDVTGKSLADATYTLGQAGLRYARAKEPSTAIAAGNVTRTDPPAGTQVARGSTVTVYESSGPPSVTVPSVVGMTQSEANAALTAKGFVVSAQTASVLDPTQNGRVQSQSPNAGSSAPQGSTVIIQVGKFGG